MIGDGPTRTCAARWHGNELARCALSRSGQTHVVSSAPTPQARKLGLRPDRIVRVEQPPPGWRFQPPAENLALVEDDEPADLIIAFFAVAAGLARRLPLLGARIHPAGAVWVAWPRRAGGHTSDITEHLIREHALPLGLVDNKVAAIDGDWSGLRLVWRLSRR
jgi:hypothetical protein